MRYRILLLIATTAVAVACNEGKGPNASHSSQGSIIDDGGIHDGGLSVVDAPLPEPLEVVKEFTCTPQFSGSDEPLAEVAGTGARIFISPTPEPCQFDLIYRPETGPDVELSSSSSGYLVVAGADRVVCASPIIHAPKATGDTDHNIYGVRLDCALRTSGGGWTSMQTILDPAGGWAPWVEAVVREDADTYTVRYIRDFSFQFVNANDEGRPPEDGIYELTLEVVNDTLVPSGSPVKVSGDFTTFEMEDPTPNCPPGEYDPDDPDCQAPPDEPVVVE